jgi:hypothetical protein
MNDEDDEGATSAPQESSLLITPALETEDIYKVERLGEGILWRAAIGGVAGYWLLVTLLAVRSVDYYGLILLGVHISIVSGIIGFFIGGALRFYYRKYGRNLGSMMRVVAGVSIALLIIGILRYIIPDDFGIGIVEWLTSSIFIGGLSGLVARLKKDATSSTGA